MAKFEVVPTIPSEYRYKYLNEGANGVCYLTTQGDVFKQFRMPCPYERELGRLSELENPSFTFPSKLVYLGVKDPLTLKGYRMNYVTGTKFSDLDPKVRMELIINASKVVEDNIIYITKESGLVIIDISNDNVLFLDNNAFNVFDTDLYDFDLYEESYDNIKANMKEWNQFMLGELKGGTRLFLSSDLNNQHEIAMIHGKYRASEVIQRVMAEIRKQTGYYPETLGDYQEGVKLIKRKEFV